MDAGLLQRRHPPLHVHHGLHLCSRILRTGELPTPAAMGRPSRHVSAPAQAQQHGQDQAMAGVAGNKQRAAFRRNSPLSGPLLQWPGRVYRVPHRVLLEVKAVYNDCDCQHLGSVFLEPASSRLQCDHSAVCWVSVCRLCYEQYGGFPGKCICIVQGVHLYWYFLPTLIV